MLALTLGYVCYRITQVFFPYVRRGMPPVVRLSLWIYAFAVLCYTVLPITPPPGMVCGQAPEPQLIPGESLVYAYKLFQVSSGWYRVINPYTVQYLLNAVLFAPLGVILWLRWNFFARLVAFVAAGISIIIEVIQATEWFGLFPCMFRTPQVDDVLLNTLGAVLGATLMVKLNCSRKFGPRTKRFKQWFCGWAEY